MTITRSLLVMDSSNVSSVSLDDADSLTINYGAASYVVRFESQSQALKVLGQLAGAASVGKELSALKLKQERIA